jgi:hypothetical protein
MSAPDTVRGTYVTVLMGNGATPEVFAVLCGITTKSLTDAIGTSDEYTRDCADPEAIPVRELITTGRSWSITGGGLMNRSQLPDLEDAMGKRKNYRFFIGEPTDEDILNGYYGGRGVLTSKTIRGDDGGKVGLDLTVMSDAAWTWTDVAHGA